MEEGENKGEKGRKREKKGKKKADCLESVRFLEEKTKCECIKIGSNKRCLRVVN
jgi:hypothetical protein